MGENWFRDRVCWLTFLFSVLVIWVHSFNAELYLGVTVTAVWVEEVEGVLGESLGQIAVPGFFMVSGYLFYRGFCWGKLISKWRSRVKSLALPYLLWNFLYYMGYVTVTRLPGLSGVVGKDPVPVSLGGLLDALVNYTYNPVFWYLFQLILLVALAPFIYLVMRRNVTGLAALILLTVGLWKGWSAAPLNLDALFYTCVAAFVSLHRDSWGKWAETGAGAGETKKAILILTLSFGVLWYLGQPNSPLVGRPVLTVGLRLWGVCASVLCVRAASLPPAKEWMKHNFFLYAIHFAWVRLFNKAGAIILPGSPVSALTMFLLMPFLMVVVSSWLGRWMRRFCPVVYRVLSGGR